jgi:NCS1 family nucleobase:cation symporter-1
LGYELKKFLQGILIADFYLVKSQHLDIPALYHPQGRYKYHYGIN